ncbi:nucleotidyl transferase AbiEii/AbiGii toxin family protein [Desulfobulbus alkaliphilus]|uniref:nucleotidyl transferase AbiEii/AbiGii toxin family protein n=1 Tax=Desulfobulbus alkaliphilus TaxID=869814 RepID=UPI003084261E
MEKELLHHDILREMSRAGFLQRLTFIGGTCLRLCYGSPRLSENLDFSGGADFTKDALVDLGSVLVKRLEVKYGLPVSVSEPVREEGNVDTWKLRMVTRPERKHLPDQRINIDICALPSYDRRPVMLRNHYGVDMGTSGLIVQAQSREEIFADKIVTFALRKNRLKNRDLWDIVWLHQQGLTVPVELVLRKVTDRRMKRDVFWDRLEQRLTLLRSDPWCQKNFLSEMRRFLPPAVVAETLAQEAFWTVLMDVVAGECDRVKNQI